ncbi:uncharacterized protein LOC133456416 [Cololabis saira]|uniref:uncharacterized protein LOC133456416 n=1 Tax=Cololabis saira TaxID=129043 RepID=UPI002AD41E93|nr:uncharacterized protein LOC133456416 [Cololabis saira]
MDDCVEKGEERPESPGSICLSMKSDRSKEEPLTFSNELGPSDTKGRIRSQRPESPGSSCLSMKSDRSMDRPPGFSNTKGRYCIQRPESPGSSCLSMKSDWSMDRPPLFSKEPGPSDTKGRYFRRANSAASSCLSTKSDVSKDLPENFNNETAPMKRSSYQSASSENLGYGKRSRASPPQVVQTPSPFVVPDVRRFMASSALRLGSLWIPASLQLLILQI